MLYVLLIPPIDWLYTLSAGVLLCFEEEMSVWYSLDLETSSLAHLHWKLVLIYTNTIEWSRWCRQKQSSVCWAPGRGGSPRPRAVVFRLEMHSCRQCGWCRGWGRVCRSRPSSLLLPSLALEVITGGYVVFVVLLHDVVRDVSATCAICAASVEVSNSHHKC